jgi:hypothetical protein
LVLRLDIVARYGLIISTSKIQLFAIPDSVTAMDWVKDSCDKPVGVVVGMFVRLRCLFTSSTVLYMVPNNTLLSFSGVLKSVIEAKFKGFVKCRKL